MSQHSTSKSPPPRTYTARRPLGKAHFTCGRCKRVHPFPDSGGAAVRCECGWRYTNVDGKITEEFTPRLGV